MKTISRFAALALALLLCAAPVFAVAPSYNEEVDATATASTVTFGFKALIVNVSNDGTNEVYVRPDGTAVAGATTAVKIPAYQGKKFCFPAGKGPAYLSVICSPAETATVRVEAYQDEGQVGACSPADTVTNFLSAYAATATFDDVTTTDDVVVGDDLTVTGAATVGETLGVTGVATFTAQPIVSSLTASRIVLSDASKGLASNGAITTNAIPKSASSGASLAASSISDSGSVVTITEPLSVTGASITQLRSIATPDEDTVADSGDGSAAAYALTPTAAVVLATCSDSDGCALTFSETGATAGEIVHIINVSANDVTIADGSGVQETGGALTLGQYDAVSFVYAATRWIQLAAVEDN